MKPASTNASVVDWGVANRPFGGEAVSGDLHLVQPFSKGGVLLAVVDGLGHGEHARAAARDAVAVLRDHAWFTVMSLIRRCHHALRGTRGVVLTLAAVDGFENTLTWLSVGNVEGRLVRAQPDEKRACESVILRAGLVGYQLPNLHASVLPLARGDLLVLATDGVGPDFATKIRPSGCPQRIANQILEEHYKGTDDGLVLVARYMGGGHG